MDRLGFGKSGLLYKSPKDKSHKVSPVEVNCNFETAPISPAIISDTLICVLPLIMYKVPSFSCFSLFVFCTIISGLPTPVITLNKDNFPTNGSAIVLKIKAEKGLVESILTSISFPSCKDFALIRFTSSGDGKHSCISSSNVLIPIIFNADPHITGAISPLALPLISPV